MRFLGALAQLKTKGAPPNTRYHKYDGIKCQDVNTETFSVKKHSVIGVQPRSKMTTGG